MQPVYLSHADHANVLYTILTWHACCSIFLYGAETVVWPYDRMHGQRHKHGDLLVTAPCESDQYIQEERINYCESVSV